MTIQPNNSTGNYRAYNRELAKIFQTAMDMAKESGHARKLSAAEICVAIAVTANHCMALAVIGGDLPVAEFDGLLAEDVAHTLARHAARAKAKLPS